MEQQFSLVLSDFFEATLEWIASWQTLDYLVLFAGLLGLAAVYLFLRADRTARYRIDREFQERADQRELALRKEVYLPAAEAIARGQDFLGKFPAMDLTRDQAQVVIDHVLGALGKAQLVASEASVRPIMAVASEFTNGYLALAARRQPLTKLKAEIADLGDSIAHLAVERDHLLASITRMAGDCSADQNGVWGETNLRFDKLHREIGSLLGQRKDRLAQHAALEHEFALEAHQYALRLIKLGIPAYLALRDELRLEIDESQYRAAAQQGIDEVERNLKALAEPNSDRTALRRVGNPAPRREPSIQAVDMPSEARLKMVAKPSS